MHPVALRGRDLNGDSISARIAGPSLCIGTIKAGLIAIAYIEMWQDSVSRDGAQELGLTNRSEQLRA